jgi:hypothetical protein
MNKKKANNFEDNNFNKVAKSMTPAIIMQTFLVIMIFFIKALVEFADKEIFLLELFYNSLWLSFFFSLIILLIFKLLSVNYTKNKINFKKNPDLIDKKYHDKLNSRFNRNLQIIVILIGVITCGANSLHLEPNEIIIGTAITILLCLLTYLTYKRYIRFLRYSVFFINFLKNILLPKD